MATGQDPHSSLQQGTYKYIDYFDVMLIGKTGMGKTTTADKLLLANPTKRDYSEGPTTEEPVHDVTSSHIQYDDIFMWHLSNKPGEVEEVTLRLKNLVFYRSLENPHEEVNKSRMENSETTEQCELLSNDTSKIRVLDAPGFYGSNAAASSADVRKRACDTTETDLSIMRKILHIKMAKNFKFNRIVYFLPEKGILERDSQILQMEISIMENYFGRSIFESMVVAVTHSGSAYKHFAKGADLFPPEDHKKTEHYFQKAMRKVFGDRGGDKALPQPPIIFISLHDTSDKILHKIRESQVSNEAVELQFNPATCARCNIKIGMLQGDGHQIEGTEEVLGTCTHDDWSSAIPYNESTCHPMMIPKYSTLQKVVGGIAHLITFRIFWGKWPSFQSLDEICIKCGKPPKVRGCHKVRTNYIKGGSDGKIFVDHTSKVDESFVIKMDENYTDDPQVEERAAMLGTGVFRTGAVNSDAIV